VTDRPRPERARDRLRADIANYAHQQRAEISPSFLFKLFFLTPGFSLVLGRRIQEGSVKIPFVGRGLRRLLWARSCIRHGCELAIGTPIGGGLYIPHPFAIVIGYGTIGRNVTILQGVTIGNRAGTDGSGTIIADGCYLGAGAKILGDVVVGENATVGANSVVLGDVPPGATAVGIPAKIIRTL